MYYVLEMGLRFAVMFHFGLVTSLHFTYTFAIRLLCRWCVRLDYSHEYVFYEISFMINFIILTSDIVNSDPCTNGISQCIASLVMMKSSASCRWWRIWLSPGMCSYVTDKSEICLKHPVTCRAVKLARAVVCVAQTTGGFRSSLGRGT